MKNMRCFVNEKRNLFSDDTDDIEIKRDREVCVKTVTGTKGKVWRGVENGKMQRSTSRQELCPVCGVRICSPCYFRSGELVGGGGGHTPTRI
jgi:hypothetical protein